MKPGTRIPLAAIVAAVVVGGVGVGLAYADPDSSPGVPSATPSAGTSDNPQGTKPRNRRAGSEHGRAKLMRLALHGEVTLGGRQVRVVVFQKGTVTAVNSTSVTVQSEDRFTATYRLGKDTVVRADKKDVGIDSVKTSAKVRVIATKGGDEQTARRVIVLRG